MDSPKRSRYLDYGLVFLSSLHSKSRNSQVVGWRRFSFLFGGGEVLGKARINSTNLLRGISEYSAFSASFALFVVSKT